MLDEVQLQKKALNCWSRNLHQLTRQRRFAVVLATALGTLHDITQHTYVKGEGAGNIISQVYAQPTHEVPKTDTHILCGTCFICADDLCQVQQLLTMCLRIICCLCVSMSSRSETGQRASYLNPHNLIVDSPATHEQIVALKSCTARPQCILIDCHYYTQLWSLESELS